MAMIEWRINGFDFSTCNCDYGCPCQFNALPTNGNCRAGVGFHVTQGHFGEIAIDGLNFGGLFAWPGPIHEGGGEALPIVDERATPAQREALLKIMSGQETDPGATFFQVFFSMLSKVHEPVFRPIRFSCDLEKGEAMFEVPGLVTARAEPIRNPVTGAPHRARVQIENGFEFSAAEFVSGDLTTHDGPVSLAWTKRHAHLAPLAITGHGIVRG
jgi:hypothetical protein